MFFEFFEFWVLVGKRLPILSSYGIVQYSIRSCWLEVRSLKQAIKLWPQTLSFLRFFAKIREKKPWHRRYGQNPGEARRARQAPFFWQKSRDHRESSPNFFMACFEANRVHRKCERRYSTVQYDTLTVSCI